MSPKPFINDIPLSILRSVILSMIISTKRLKSAMESPAAVRFLKTVIDEKNAPLLELLLEHGANVHRRTDRLSAIEYVCKAKTTLKLCVSSNGKWIVSALLDHANVVRLIDHGSDGGGLSLLHRIATSKNASNILWLVRNLVDRGLYVNEWRHKDVLVGVVQFSCTTLLCTRSSAQEVLLELGADPTAAAPDEHTLDAAQAAMSCGNVSFLNRLLIHTTTTAKAAWPCMDWT